MCAKMGFSNAIDGLRKWVFSRANGSDGDLGKGGVLFSPMGGNGGKLVGGFENNGTKKPGPSLATKDVVSSPKPTSEKKTQVSFFSQRNNHSRFVLDFVKKKLIIPTRLIL